MPDLTEKVSRTPRIALSHTLEYGTVCIDACTYMYVKELAGTFGFSGHPEVRSGFR